MGMFDYVKYTMPCPECGHLLDSFQSKDGHCELDVIDFWKVNRFYTNCDGCQAWVEFERKARPKCSIKNYKMSVKTEG